MRKSDWIPIAGMTFLGIGIAPAHPGPGVALVVVTLGTAAFGAVMQRATRFTGI